LAVTRRWLGGQPEVFLDTYKKVSDEARRTFRRGDDFHPRNGAGIHVGGWFVAVVGVDKAYSPLEAWYVAVVVDD